MTMSIAVKAILVLMTIVAVISLTLSLTSPAVRVLFGFADDASLDSNTKSEYLQSRIDNKETIDSINALLFSVNTIAHYDTNLKSQSERDAFLTKMFSNEQERKFGSKTVKYTFSNVENIFVDDASLGNGKAEIMDSLLRCYYMFEDNGKKKTRCFEMQLNKGTLDVNALTNYVDEYKTKYCVGDENCAEIIDLLFKNDAKRVEIDGTIGSDFYMCAEAGAGHISHIFTDRIYLTTSLSHHACKKDETADDTLGMKITDFYMQQDVGPIGDPKSFVTGYKPNVFYYEQLNPAVAQDFEADIYDWTLTDAGGVIFWETLFFALFDAVPMGKAIAKGVGTAILKEAGQELSEEAVEKVAKETIENLLKKFKSAFSEATGLLDMFKKLKTVIDDDVLSIAKKTVRVPVNSLTDIFKLLRPAQMTDDAFELFGPSFGKRFFRSADEIAEKLTKELGEEGIEQLNKKLGVETLEEAIEKMTSEQTQVFAIVLKDIYKEPRYFKNQEITEEGWKYMKNMLDGQSDNVLRELLGESFEDSTSLSIKKVLSGANDEMIKGMKKGFSFKQIQRYIKRQSLILNYMAGNIEKLKYLAKGSDDKVLKELFEKPNRQFGSMLESSRDVRKFFDANSMQLESLQKLYGQEALKDLYDKPLEQVFKQAGSEVTENQRFWLEIDTYVMREFNKRGGANPFWRGVKDPNFRRYVVFLAGVYYVSAKEQSDAEMFHPVGINAFGFKTSLSTPAVFDDYIRTGWNYPQDKKDYEEYFLHYGGSEIPKAGSTDETKTDEELSYEEQLYVTEKYTGTIPELEKYFVYLSKDKARFWFDQSPERFYLIAPCKADVNVKITQAKCYGTPNDYKPGVNVPLLGNLFSKDALYVTSTTKNNPVLDRKVEPFDGTQNMLYRVDENGDIVKECYQGLGDQIKTVFSQESVYTPTSIEVNPVLDRSLDPNYCYAGMDGTQTAAWIGLNLAAPLVSGGILGLGCGIATGGTFAMPCYYIGSYFGGIAGSLAYQAMESGHLGGKFSYPYHNTRGY